MKITRIRFLRTGAALLLLLVGAGCGNIDTSVAGDPNRTLNGAVSFSGSIPAGAEIVVRVVEPPSSEPGRAVGKDMPVATLPAVQRVERVLGETKMIVDKLATEPVPFRVEYNADDAVLRRGVNVDVRISIGGKVRMRTVNAHLLTLRAAPFRQDVAVQSVQ